jgi:hypothetical protein
MTEERWRALTTLHDEISAQVLAESLRTRGVPATVRADTALLGVARACRVMVPAHLVHRAEWVLKSESVSDEELEELAMRAARDADDQSS